MSKDQISKSYIERQKVIHAKKPLATNRNALIIGVDPGNIGYAIRKKLSELSFSISSPHILDFDVTEPWHRTYYKNFDTLILCNGYTNLNWFEDIPASNIEYIFNVNVIGSLKTAQQFVRGTIDQPYKKYIVFIGSMAYKNVLNGSSIYCASKAALAHATKCLGWELAPKGFNVFCVHPSNVENSPMSEKTIRDLMRYRNLTREAAEAYWGAVLPKDKWLQKEDIAETVAWLVSGKADYLSGGNIDMAGGQR